MVNQSCERITLYAVAVCVIIFAILYNVMQTTDPEAQIKKIKNELKELPKLESQLMQKKVE